MLGISKDNASSHQKFIEKFNLPFILLTDPEPFNVSSDYDSYGLKKFMGKESVSYTHLTLPTTPYV